AGPPHYPQAEFFRETRKSLPDREIANGVLVERLKSFVPEKRTAWHRIAAELSYFLHGILALATRRVTRAPLVLSLCPSILTVALAWFARAPGGRHVAIVHDIQSGLARGLGLLTNPLLHRAMQVCERALLNRADAIVVLTEAMKEELRRMGVVAPIEVVRIWVDVEGIV